MTHDNRRRTLRALGGLAVASASFLAFAPTAAAHPLGNFTTNTSVGITVSPDGLAVAYVVDRAEIPTLRTAHDIDRDGNGTASTAELARYAGTLCGDVADGLGVTVDGEAVAIASGDASASYLPGSAGLQTLRIDCDLSGAVDLSSGDHTVRIENGWVGNLIGWHEVFAVGDRVILGDTDLPTTSPSDSLRSYPEAQLADPPDVRSTSFVTEPGGAAAPATDTEGGVPRATISAIPAVDRASQSFTDLVSREKLTLGVAVLGLLLAIVLGSLHALAPGHGKTVIAAYLLGEQGTTRQAMALCATVTITHTAGVLVLGTILTVTTVVAPERLYPILGAASGLLVASIGVTMFRRAKRQRPSTAAALAGHSHDHHEHGHADHGHGHDHAHQHDREHDGAHAAAVHRHGAFGHSHPDPSEPLSWRSLVGMGFAGGMVPSPSALLVLLGAIALGRTWFGVALVVAYGLGMAASLIAAGLLLLRIRNRLDRYLATRKGRRMSERLVLMPSFTAAVVVLGGLYIAARAAFQL